jgi:hypothetical protein
VKRFVIWGGLEGLESHRHIHRHFHNTALKMGIESVWVKDDPSSRVYITPDSTVLTADILGRNLGSAVPGADYVLHNFDGTSEICQTVIPEHLLRIQVWTNDAMGEEWAPFRSFYKEGAVLFQPWGTNLLSEEFFDPIFNPLSQEIVFVGAVWSDQHEGVELGNQRTIYVLSRVCRDRRLHFRHLTQISDEENLNAVRSARLAPAFAGEWQVDHNYLPCRAFKNVSYGALGITNVPSLAEMLGCPAGPVEETVGWALSLKRSEYVSRVHSQQKFVSHYSYRESIQAIDRAFKEIHG